MGYADQPTRRRSSLYSLQARRRQQAAAGPRRSPIRRSRPTARRSPSRSSSGVKFSPPVNREVTSKDVKYAIERGFFNTVNNGYAGAYFGDLEGAEGRRRSRARRSRASRRPTISTIVFKLKPRRSAARRRARGRARACRSRRRCRRSTRRSSTRRTRRPTAPTRSPPVRT